MASFVLWGVGGHCVSVLAGMRRCGEVGPSCSLLLGAAAGLARTIRVGSEVMLFRGEDLRPPQEVICI